MQSPNHTQVANEFIEMMDRFSGSAVKVGLAIFRKTIGWQKYSDKVSYSQLQEMTGITHNTSLKKAINELVKAKIITVSGDEKRGYTYTLNFTSAKSDIDSSAESDTDSEKTSAKSDTTKETCIKETNKQTCAVDVNLDLLKEYQPMVSDTAETKEAIQSLTAEFGGSEGVADYLYFVNKKAIENAKSNVPAFFVKAIHGKWYLEEWQGIKDQEVKKEADKQYCPVCESEFDGYCCKTCEYDIWKDLEEHKKRYEENKIIEADPDSRKAILIQIQRTEKTVEIIKNSPVGSKDSLEYWEGQLEELHLKLDVLDSKDPATQQRKEPALIF